MEYLKVDMAVVAEVGLVPAVLYAYFVFRSKWLSEENGWFELDTKQILEALGISRMSFGRYRDLLVAHGLIEYEAGNNQLIKPQYRIMR